MKGIALKKKSLVVDWMKKYSYQSPNLTAVNRQKAKPPRNTCMRMEINRKCCVDLKVKLSNPCSSRRLHIGEGE